MGSGGGCVSVTYDTRGGCVSVMYDTRGGCVSGPNVPMAVPQLCRTDSRGMQAVEGMWRRQGERERGKEREGEGTRIRRKGGRD